MANANTKHSIGLRRKTAAAWVSEQRKSGARGQVNIVGSMDEINKFTAGLEKIEGKSRIEKCLFLLDFYKNNAK